MILYRYILSQFISPFLYSIFIILMMFFMQLAAAILPRVLYKGVPWSIVAELFAVNMASVVVLSIPMALLVASLMTMGKLSANNEITAIKASGKGVMFILPPIIAISLVVSVLLLHFNNMVLPDANHHASQLFSDIMRKKPAAMIEPKLLIKDFPGYALLVDSVETSTGKLFDIAIFSEERDGSISLTVADSGTIFMTSDEKDLELTLFNGEVHSNPSGNNSNYYKIDFNTQQIYIPNPDSKLNRSDNKRKSDRDKGSKELLTDVNRFQKDVDDINSNHKARIDKLIDNLNRLDSATIDSTLVFDNFEQWCASIESATNRDLHNGVRKENNLASMRVRRLDRKKREIDKNMVEFYKKQAISVAAIIFAILGVPLGIMARSGSVAISASYSIFFFIIYYAFLIGGEFLSDRGIMPPALTMWLGNITLGTLAIYLLRQTVKEQAFINWKFIRKVLFSPLLILKKLFKFKIKKRKPLNIFQKIFSTPSLILKKIFPILPSYIMGRFFSYLITITLGLIVLTVVIDYVSNINSFEGAMAKELINYYIYFIGWFISIILPIALLLASMMSIGSFSKTNEITAIKAAGISMIKVTIPLIIAGLLFSGFSFWFSETVLPEANRKRAILKETFRARRGNRPIPTINHKYRRNFYYFGNNGSIYNIKHFQTEPPRGDKVLKYEIKDNRLYSVITATKMINEEDRWVLYDGEERIFNNGSYLTRHFKKEVDKDITASPIDMVKTVRSIDELSYGELKSAMKVVKERGEDTSKYEADLNFKFALPLMNLVVILLGIAVTARADKRGGTVHFGSGIGLVFLYWGLAQFLLIFGRNGFLPPYVAAWSGTLFFLVLGTYLYRRASQ